MPQRLISLDKKWVLISLVIILAILGFMALVVLTVEDYKPMWTDGQTDLTPPMFYDYKG